MSIQIHPLTLIAETICQGEKTAKRRLSNERDWLYYELLNIEREFKDESVTEYLQSSFRNARNS